MEEYDESHTNKLSRKVKENPFMPIGKFTVGFVKIIFFILK